MRIHRSRYNGPLTTSTWVNKGKPEKTVSWISSVLMVASTCTYPHTHTSAVYRLGVINSTEPDEWACPRVLDPFVVPYPVPYDRRSENGEKW